MDEVISKSEVEWVEGWVFWDEIEMYLLNGVRTMKSSLTLNPMG